MADFEWVVKNGDLEQVRKFAEKDASVVNTEVKGRIPIIVAADYGQTEVIEYLISRGANVNVVDQNGITPLLSAVFEGHVECVKLLLSKGANKTGKGPNGMSYIECAETDEIKKLLA